MNQADAIDVLTSCGETVAALRAEHDAIESISQVFNRAMIAAAEDQLMGRILDLALDFCHTHFEHEERCLRQHGVDLEDHAAAHQLFCHRLEEARAAVRAGNPHAILDAVDVLQGLQDHTERFDRPAYEGLLALSPLPTPFHRLVERMRRKPAEG
jgi:hemerythrin